MFINFPNVYSKKLLNDVEWKNQRIFCGKIEFLGHTLKKKSLEKLTFTDYIEFKK